jgi:glycosyltransferase involved in cell wall biosynthesis
MGCKLSIITINYNNKEGLIKTFMSVDSQTWTDFEYIVIDGGSSDGGKELIQQNPRIDYWVSEKDSGVYQAMNKGIRNATGDYVIFMNSGDFFYDKMVLEKVQTSFESGIDILYGNSMFFKDSGFKKLEIPPEKLNFGFFFNYGINHQATFIKKNLFHQYFLYNEDYKISADWEFFIVLICLYGVSHHHIDQVICYYDFSGISSNPKNQFISEKERKMTFQKYFPSFIDDYQDIKNINEKRIKQVIRIKKYPVAWRFLKWSIDIILIFLPKSK